MKKKIVGIVVCMLVIALWSFSAASIQSDKPSTQDIAPVGMQPLSIQYHRGQAPIVQPVGIASTQREKPSVVGTDSQVTNFTQADSHPWVEVDNNGNPMVVYDHDSGLGYHEIYLQRSPDGGKTWPADKRYYLAGNASTSVINPVIELVDNGTRALVLFQAEKLDPRWFTVDLVNIDDPSTWVVISGQNSSVNPWMGQAALDGVGDHIGVWAYISHVIWGGYDCNSTFDMHWATDIDNGSTYRGLFFYYTGPGYSYCRPTVAAGTKYLYGAAQHNLPIHQSLICVTWGPTENLSFPNWKYFFFGVPGGHNLTNPDLAASGQYAYLAVQSDDKHNADILCYTPPPSGTGPWIKHIVVNSSDNEMYPSITALGLTAVCTFVKNGNLYMVKSTDGGITWGAPVQINNLANHIIGEYRCANVEGQYSVWMDDRNANADIYTNTISMPWLALKKCSGGFGCKVEIANVGTEDASAIEWNMHVEGGQKGKINVSTNGTVNITVGKSVKVKSGLFFGLGKIWVNATVAGSKLEKEGKHFLIFSIVK